MAKKESRHHIVISGTGRTGTTLLVEILTLCGMDTGFQPSDFNDPAKKNQVSHGGLEHDVRDNGSPYVVKSPWFCDYAHEVFASPHIFLDHLIIPVRNVGRAAESRRKVNRLHQHGGSLWHTKSMKAGDQERVLEQQLYKLLLHASITLTPVTLLHFPFFVTNPTYLYHKLRMILPVGVGRNVFEEAHKERVDLSLVDYGEIF